MNPPVKLASFFHRGVPFNVIRDDLLPGGTKQRALETYLESFSNVTEYVYAGPDTGYTQIALAHVCHRLNKRAVIFASGLKGTPAETCQRAAEYEGVTMHHLKTDFKGIMEAASKYVKTTSGSVLIPFELANTNYLNILIERLKEAVADIPAPKRVWIPTGNGTLLRALAAVWPKSKLLVVSVIKPIDWKLYPEEIQRNVKEYSATAHYKVFEEVKPHDTPPYPSLPAYDSKVWIFAKNDLQPNDYIWNVGAGI